MTVIVEVNGEEWEFPDEESADRYFAKNFKAGPSGFEAGEAAPKALTLMTPAMQREHAIQAVGREYTPETDPDRVRQFGDPTGGRRQWEWMKTQGRGLLSNAALPGTGIAYGLMGAQDRARRNGGVNAMLSPSELWKGFKQEREHFNKETGKWADDAPIASAIGSIPKNVVEYELGTKLLKAPFQGGKLAKWADATKLGGLAKWLGRGTAGGATNAGIGQLEHPGEGAGHDFAMGFVGENAVPTMRAALSGSKRFGRWAGGKLIGSVLPQIKRERVKNLRQGFNLGEELYDRGFWGTRGGMERRADKALSEAEANLQERLADKSKIDDPKIRNNPVADEIRDVKKNYEGMVGEEGSRSAIDKMATEAEGAEPMTVAKANETKRNVYRELGERRYQIQGADPTTTAGQKAQARGLRKEIERIVPQSEPLNKELKVYGKAKTALEDAEAGRKGMLPLGLKDAALITGLSGYGAATGGLTKSAAYGLAGWLSGAPVVRTGAAQSLRRAVQGGEWLAKQLAPVGGAARFVPPALSGLNQESR